jgi:hypothetical protein
VNTVRTASFRYFSVAVVALSIPALCFSGFVFFGLWAASLNGLGTARGAVALLFAISFPALCIFGPVQARSSNNSRGAWAWLLSFLVPFAGLLAMMHF